MQAPKRLVAKSATPERTEVGCNPGRPIDGVGTARLLEAMSENRHPTEKQLTGQGPQDDSSPTAFSNLPGRYFVLSYLRTVGFLFNRLSSECYLICPGPRLPMDLQQ